MTMQVLDFLLEELESKLGESSFVTVRQLVDCGIFGSMSSARTALLKGNLPFILISPRRRAIPREAVIEFLRDNFNESPCVRKSVNPKKKIKKISAC